MSFPSQKDFLSIELVHGRVKVMVDLGSGPLTLMTDRRYNNGTWYKIAFQRNRKQGGCTGCTSMVLAAPLRTNSALKSVGVMLR